MAFMHTIRYTIFFYFKQLNLISENNRLMQNIFNYLSSLFQLVNQ